ncbi:hypothetical protein QUA81_03775 [Microcoleus sp. F6_B4]
MEPILGPVLGNGATYKSKWRLLLNPKAKIDAPNTIQDFVLSYSGSQKDSRT